MEAQEEFDHQALIIKGKRTKRQRSLSSFGVTVTVTSSSSSACGGGPAEEYNSISSPVTSGERTEEEEDMANCLIMLAQSDGPRRSNIGERFQMVTATSNKGVAYAYECKTCNRSFPSFQALGGHRASHKKPKGAMADDKKPPVPAVKDHVIQDADQFNGENQAVVALQVGNNNSKGNCHGNKGYKIHECSICGSEFSSGQALGGHMRRHRAAAASNQAAVSVETTSSPMESRNGDGIKPRNILPLDLNLPAPEDDPRDSKFQFGAAQQAIVFSTPALVDCHY
ncbi:Copper/zinc superoxide dismutase 2 isoform 1 [Hibiscus syriacus]|uniref:Copper/zinc superoxide dismutase 2 isoform 1 n=1 Tax=Hibiscus syriacus TaxID=106335 RepID=A0A6A3A8W3_HIBSY|nr:zinc finger protein ZAT5-like [Hibiscus syriacus]KAE8700197.1 Copper/zinc superoxide dismutase 2 isoform 1 [Hibiscus syriacus]